MSGEYFTIMKQLIAEYENQPRVSGEYSTVSSTYQQAVRNQPRVSGEYSPLPNKAVATP